MSVTVATILANNADGSEVSRHPHPLRSHRGSPVIPFPDFQDDSALPSRVVGSIEPGYDANHPRSRWSESTRDTAYDSILDERQSVPISPYSSFSGIFPSPRTKTGFHGSPLATPSTKDSFPIIPTRPPLTPTVTDPTFYEIDWKSEKRVVIDEVTDTTNACTTTTEISHHLQLILVLYLFTFIHGMNMTALVGLLSHIVDGYQCSPMQAFWAVIAYFLSTVVLPPLLPSLSCPRILKSLLLIGSVAFAGGSTLCALAPGYTTFLLGRILQGVSCGLCICLLTRTTSSSLSKRTCYTALALTCWIGAAGAPLLGAALTNVNWRHMFWLSAGGGAVIFIVTVLAEIPANIEHPASEKQRSTSWALALASLTLVSVAVAWTETLYAWSSWPVLLPLIPGLLLALAAIVTGCWKGQMHLRPLALLRSSTLLTQGLLFSGIIHLLPLMLQSSSTLQSSLKLLPLLAGILVSAALVSLILPRVNQQLALTTSSVLTTTTTGLLLRIHPNSSNIITIPLLLLLGIALGSLHSSTSSTLLSYPHTLGMTLGVVLASSIYLNNASSSHPFRPVWITLTTISAPVSLAQIAVAVWDVRYIRKACN